MVPGSEYERLSDGAHLAVVLAERDARLAGHEVVSTEHLLVTLVESDEDVRGRLAVFGIGPEALRARVEEWTHNSLPVQQAAFAPSLRRTVQLAGRMAVQDRSATIEGRHLLSALLEVEDEFVLRVLISLGVDPGALRRRNTMRARRGEVRVDDEPAGRRRSLRTLLTGR